MAAELLKADPVPMLVDGKAYTSQQTYDVVDPHKPSKVLHKVSTASSSDVSHILASSARALASWRKTSVLDRREIFAKAARIIRDRAAEFAEVEVAETTTGPAWAAVTGAITAATVEELAGVVTNALRGEIAEFDEASGKTGLIVREPYGVVLGIAPWNAPLILGCRSVANAIIGGNTAILKTSEFSPRTHLIIGAIFAEAGLPPGVLNVVHVATKDAAVLTEQLIEHPAVGKVNFTGSTAVGAKIAEVCGRHLKPCVMELGGKAPVVVLPDADVELAANNVAFGFTLHQGQVCMATNTAIVHRSIAKKFVSTLESVLPSKTPANGLFTAASAARSASLVEDARSKGASLSEAYEEPSGEGRNVVRPVVVKGLTSEMRVWKEEAFSPVLGVVEYDEIGQAIEYANASEYGLAAAVWSKNHGTALEVARQIHSGMVHINGPTIHDPAHMPHGGVKKSGWGRFNGIEGIREFTCTKVITIQPGHQYPIP